MGLSFSLLLAAVGAVLIWAVSATTSGINIHTVGIILLIVGIIGFVVSLFFWSSWGGFGSRTAGAGRSTVITEHTEPRI
jgi:hypothetical protein